MVCICVFIEYHILNIRLFRCTYYDIGDYGVHKKHLFYSETQPEQKYEIYFLIFIWPESKIEF